MPELALTNPQYTEANVIKAVIVGFYYPLANSEYGRVLRSVEFVFANDGIGDPSFRLTLASGQTIDVTGLGPERAVDQQIIDTARTRAFARLKRTVGADYLRQMNAVMP